MTQRQEGLVRLHAIVVAAVACVTLSISDLQAKTVEIKVVGTHGAADPLRFDPPAVDANPGDDVNWTNTTTLTHTISPDTDGAFMEKDPFKPNDTYKITIPADAAAGPIPYHCNFHPMNATINVVKPDAPKPDTPKQ